MFIQIADIDSFFIQAGGYLKLGTLMRLLNLVLALLLVRTDSQRRQHSVVTEREIKKRTVDVQGTYTINVTPDVAYVSLLLETLDAKSASTAYTLHNKIINSVINKLTSDVGVPSKDISTIGFTLQPEYGYDNGKRSYLGVKASQNLLVKTKNLNQVSKILDSSLAASNSKIQINGVTYTVENREAFSVEARSKAIVDATEKARQLCEATGTKLGRPLSIHEDELGLSGGTNKYHNALAKSSAADDSTSANVPRGEMQMQHNVYITFEVLLDRDTSIPSTSSQSQVVSIPEVQEGAFDEVEDVPIPPPVEVEGDAVRSRVRGRGRGGSRTRLRGRSGTGGEQN